MALATIAVIVLVAAIGFGLAWLVGRLADRDKARRAEAPRELKGARPADATAPPPGAPGAVFAAAGMCPTCRTPYRPDLNFCWACGRDKVA